MRAAPLGERGALLDAEAVLLVDDGNGEVAEADLLLDQRVRADRDLHVAGGDQLPHVGVLLRAEGARQQRHPHAELRADSLDGEEVLLGEHLGRRHQRALPSRLDGPQQRRERDDGLAGADVALEQPLHRGRARQIAVDLGDRLLLGIGEREREHLAVPVEELAGRRQRLRDESLALRRPPRERELEDEELVEGEPPPALLCLLRRARMVHRDERIGPQRQPLRDGERCGQRIAVGADVLERRRDEGAELLLGQRLAGGVHRRVVGRLGRLAEVVALDLEAVAIGLATQPDLRARCQLRLEPGLVEPGRLDLAGVVRDAGAEDLQPAAAAARRGGEHDPLDHGLVGAEEVADRPLVDRALVAARAVVEQVADRAEAELRETVPHRRPDARQRLDTRREHVGARSATRARPARRRRQAGERDRQLECCSGWWHRTEYRTGTCGRRPVDARPEPGVATRLRVVLEPEEADRARAGMGADDCAEVLDELDLGLRPRLRDEVGQHLDPLRCVGVRDRDPQAGHVLGRGGEDAGELLERLLAAPHLADRMDHALVDRQDRLHVEQGAGERLGAADATALLEILERGDREDDAVLLLEPRDQRLDLLVGRAPREPALDREREEPDRERRSLGVDDAGSGRRPPASAAVTADWYVPESFADSCRA